MFLNFSIGVDLFEMLLALTDLKCIQLTANVVDGCLLVRITPTDHPDHSALCWLEPLNSPTGQGPEFRGASSV